jgi:predicted  nucleic acid-binding Zn ribbon protein
VFVKAKLPGSADSAAPFNTIELFICPECNGGNLLEKEDHLACPSCGTKWSLKDGIFDFRERMK